MTEADNSSSAGAAADPVLVSNQVKILQEALLEVIEQNERLQAQNTSLKKESEAKDNAIAELAAALDAQTNGAIQNALDQMHEQ